MHVKLLPNGARALLMHLSATSIPTLPSHTFQPNLLVCVSSRYGFVARPAPATNFSFIRLATLRQAASSHPGQQHSLDRAGITAVRPPLTYLTVARGVVARHSPVMPASSTRILHALFAHLTFPSKLPSKADVDDAAVASHVLKLARGAAEAIRDCPEQPDRDLWNRIARALISCQALHSSGWLSKDSLFDAFQNLDPGNFLLLHVKSQNAALFIHRQGKDHVTFEAFEASSMGESVLASQGPLIWDFPGSAVTLPIAVFHNPEFLNSACAFLDQASQLSLKEFAATIYKAGQSTFENRQTADPTLISHSFMTLLEAWGTRQDPKLLRKHIRDDISWGPGAETPWRRCPMWLILRVGVQRLLNHELQEPESRLHYKLFICTVLRDFARVFSNEPGLELEDLKHVCQKIARRLFKIDDDVKSCQTIRRDHVELLAHFQTSFELLLEGINTRIIREWSDYKRLFKRPIPHFRREAPRQDLTLSLRNSRKILNDFLREGQDMLRNPLKFRRPVPMSGHQIDRKGSKSIDRLSQCLGMSQQESAIENLLAFSADRSDCTALARHVIEYQDAATLAYDGDPEGRSYMILTLMDLWVAMDKSACLLYPLLLDFCPVFPAGMLDVLWLPRRQDVVRLNNIETYLNGRRRTARRNAPSLFSNPTAGCFAERYFNEYDDGMALQHLHKEITEASQTRKIQHEREWRQKHDEFDRIMLEASEMSCVQKLDSDGRPQHFPSSCPKCIKERQASHIRIQRHEDYLPEGSAEATVVAKVVVFELAAPATFKDYRDATWKILSELTRRPTLPDHKPGVILEEHGPLQHFVPPHLLDPGLPRTVVLASRTKPFLATHYRPVPFPVKFEQVCRPTGLNYVMYDQIKEVWANGSGQVSQQPSLQPHCEASPLLQGTAFSSLDSVMGGMTANELIATQFECPKAINANEFNSFRDLQCGISLLWIRLLRELGSTSLNWGSSHAAALVSRLVLQVGPRCLDGDIADQAEEQRRPYLRAKLWILADANFCQKIVQLVRDQLSALRTNWREGQLVDNLLTIILAILEFAEGCTVLQSARKTLDEVRCMMIDWMRNLWVVLQETTDKDSHQSRSLNALWAALVCRRTFTSSDQDDADTFDSSDSLQSYVESSFAFQQNLPEDLAYLPATLRYAIHRDCRNSQRLQSSFARAIYNDPRAFAGALSQVMPFASRNTVKPFQSWSMTGDGNTGQNSWIVATTAATENENPQQIQYSITCGFLLVDGAPLRGLPREYKSEATLIMLFGHQNRQVTASSMPGMEYQFIQTNHSPTVHVGRPNGRLLIRMISVNRDMTTEVWELLPPALFQNLQDNTLDLPASLVHGCVHWMSLMTGKIYIRDCMSPFVSKASEWRLDLGTQMATRRYSTLIDPYSPTFKRMTDVFKDFEDRHNILVYQSHNPKRGVATLRVDLRRLNIDFFVRNGVLESPRLNASICHDQEIGVFHGLRSMLVLQSTHPVPVKYILVPFGDFAFRRDGPHVDIRISTTGEYTRLTVDATLGRIVCPMEPRVIYFTAYLHALTSSVVPDALTGRTGREQALQILSSAASQPWEPLGIAPTQLLLRIAALTPQRQYYPPEARVMARTEWQDGLTSFIQSHSFRPLVESLVRRSDELSRFSASPQSVLTQLPMSAPELGTRHHAMHQDYCDELCLSRCYPSGSDPSVYDSRDQVCLSGLSEAIGEFCTVIKQQPESFQTPKNAPNLLSGLKSIGGFNEVFDPSLLHQILAVDIADVLGSLCNACAELRQDGKLFELSFFFAALVSGHPNEIELIRILLAFAVLQKLDQVEAPRGDRFDEFQHNFVPSTKDIECIVREAAMPYKDPFERHERMNLTWTELKDLRARKSDHDARIVADTRALSWAILKQWPKPRIAANLGDLEPGARIPGIETLNVEHALRIVQPTWASWIQNMELTRYLSNLQTLFDQSFAPDAYTFSRSGNYSGHYAVRKSARRSGAEIPRLPDILSTCRLSPKVLGRIVSQADLEVITRVPAENERDLQARGAQELHDIICHLKKSTGIVRKQYALSLENSLLALERRTSSILVQASLSAAPDMRACSDAEQKTADLLQLIRTSLRQDSRSRWLRYGLWPSITPMTLLPHISTKSPTILPATLRELLIAYGTQITGFQRLVRILTLHKQRDSIRLEDELTNSGHNGWTPSEHPDWLLIEIGADLLIREEQAIVAMEIMRPRSQMNSVLQLNMGKGKSSCIIPMVAAEMADGRQLVRVVVPKPLLRQSATWLQARLGTGLLDLSVTHAPFSRKTPTDRETVKAFHDLHRNALRQRGVVLTLPEHLLSFRLSGLQRLSDGRLPEAALMLKIQKWLETYCRDVLDESDVLLAPRVQLIYPSGTQSLVAGHPHRWTTIEAVLSIVRGHFSGLVRDFHGAIEVVERGHCYPSVFFLRKEAEDALISRSTHDVLGGYGSLLPANKLSPGEVEAVRRYLSLARLSREEALSTENLFTGDPIAQDNLLLLRGLFTHRVLILCLNKRYNVQYGLHPLRDPIAVPYHAKGRPSEQAEWGHPDVALVFTCLAFYYRGLDVSQLKKCLMRLTKLDDPASEYNRWTQDCETLPPSLKNWNTINTDDVVQMRTLWEYLTRRIVVINFFLNTFLFPYHAKQFRKKLQASGWDIPQMANAVTLASNNHQPRALGMTTGFSGTNDNRDLLPLSIMQQDLPQMLHTNAEVLSYLLHPRNRTYSVLQDYRGRFGEDRFLAELKSRRIKVLIDAGAFILEMSNQDVATAWLSVDPAPPAAIYFAQDGRAMVRYRKGMETPLVNTPFSEDLGECLVYFDEQNTRGTDLKLPQYAVGAVTLAPGQSKDHTVQACMRLRQLGTTQAIQFFAPPEVNHSISDYKTSVGRGGSRTESCDVVGWLLEQTCNFLNQQTPLYYSQGMDFCRRRQALSPDADPTTNEHHCREVLRVLEQTEKLSLHALYSPVSRHRAKALSPDGWDMPMKTYVGVLERLRRSFQDDGEAVHASALAEVEQEREVAVEVQTIQAPQKPTVYTPLRHGHLEHDVLQFARFGVFRFQSVVYYPCFSALRATGICNSYGFKDTAFETNLFVTKDFANTIILPGGKPIDDALRPVQWILLSHEEDQALIVSPHEAELLVPALRRFSDLKASLCVYSAPVTRRMNEFNELTYYAFPRLPDHVKLAPALKRDLGIFAGRLYFAFSEYQETVQFLGIKTPQDADDPRAEGERSRLTTKPTAFMREWLGLRRRGHDIAESPMGYICQGKALEGDHAFFEGSKGEEGGAELAQAAGGLQEHGVMGVDGAGGALGEEDEYEDDDDDDEFPEDEVVRDDGSVEDEASAARENGLERPR